MGSYALKCLPVLKKVFCCKKRNCLLADLTWQPGFQLKSGFGLISYSPPSPSPSLGAYILKVLTQYDCFWKTAILKIFTVEYFSTMVSEL